ncbi:MAG TPA: MoxR family ATPase [Flavilitoribacter sp.]|nr:MoxR family ATPase [Flavilitoribacter sp.]HMQ86735.1 MoxR family ATPase [Flavilitoribacter sp.]
MNPKPYKGEALLTAKYNLMPYFPDPKLVQAVEAARLLRRPLLLRGEPGCGKTRLAEALAFELYGKNFNHPEEGRYFEWHIKSTSKAKEGIYTFDHLGRLRDVQDPAVDSQPKEKYVEYGPLGKAFKASTADKPAVLLIDEIDKADIDFPNDLLNELEWKPGKSIPIPESGEKIDIDYPPIVIITSNDERDLPSAFLRRCIFYYIDFPEESNLLKIAGAYLKEQTHTLPEPAQKQLIKQFNEERIKMGSRATTDKKPSTSELLDWLQLFAYHLALGNLKLNDRNELVLPDGEILYPEALFKTESDLRSATGKKAK